jgi:hypothetical protein
MFGKYNGFVSKARVSAFMHFLVIYIEVLLDCGWLVSVHLISNSSAKICNNSAKICNNSAKIRNKLI